MPVIAFLCMLLAHLQQKGKYSGLHIRVVASCTVRTLIATSEAWIAFHFRILLNLHWALYELYTLWITNDILADSTRVESVATLPKENINILKIREPHTLIQQDGWKYMHVATAAKRELRSIYSIGLSRLPTGLFVKNAFSSQRRKMTTYNVVRMCVYAH